MLETVTSVKGSGRITWVATCRLCGAAEMHDLPTGSFPGNEFVGWAFQNLRVKGCLRTLALCPDCAKKATAEKENEVRCGINAKRPICKDCVHYCQIAGYDMGVCAAKVRVPNTSAYTRGCQEFLRRVVTGQRTAEKEDQAFTVRTCRNCVYFNRHGTGNYAGVCIEGERFGRGSKATLASSPCICGAWKARGAKEVAKRETKGEDHSHAGGLKLEDSAEGGRALGPDVTIDWDMPWVTEEAAIRFAAEAMGNREGREKEREMASVFDVIVYERVYDEDTGEQTGVERLEEHVDVEAGSAGEALLEVALKGTLKEYAKDRLKWTVVERELRPF